MDRNSNRAPYSKTQALVLIMTCGLAYTAIVYGSRMPQVYYNIFQEAFGYTGSQIGLFITLNSFISVPGYFVSGLLTDIFGVKRLLIISYLGSAACILGLSTFPPFPIACVLAIVLGITCVVTFWGAMANFVRSLGAAKDEGGRYGLLYMFAGIGGAAVGFMGAWATKTFDSSLACRLIYYVYALIALIAAAVCAKLYHEPARTEGERLSLRQVVAILRLPEMWLLAGAIFMPYLMFMGLTYLSGPMLEEVFGTSVAVVTIISAVRGFIMRMVATPISGKLIDKMGSSRVILIVNLGMLTTMVAFMIMPWDSAFAGMAIALVIAIAFVYNLLSPTWLAGVSEIDIPQSARGTAVGLLTCLAFSSDMYAYSIMGGVMDANGVFGYRILLAVLIVAALLGTLLIIVFRRRVSARQARR